MNQHTTHCTVMNRHTALCDGSAHSILQWIGTQRTVRHQHTTHCDERQMAFVAEASKNPHQHTVMNRHTKLCDGSAHNILRWISTQHSVRNQHTTYCDGSAYKILWGISTQDTVMDQHHTVMYQYTTYCTLSTRMTQCIGTRQNAAY